VVIVGCGFGGLFAARALRRGPVQVTVIDRTNHHLFQPLLYQLATGILSSGEIAPPIRDVLRRQHNTRVLLGDVVGIDADRRSLAVQTLGSKWEVGYDSLIIAAGAAQSYFGHDEFAAAAPGLKSLDDALEIRARIFGAFELAEREPDPGERARLMTFVVIGAGPTGVEMAGQIAELSHRALGRNFRSIDPRRARVLLLDGGHQLLASFPESLQRRTVKDLARLGVEIHLGVRVTGVDVSGVDTDSTDPALEMIPAAVKIWAAGVQASPLGHALADATGAAVDRAGRVQVRDDCTVRAVQVPRPRVDGDDLALPGGGDPRAASALRLHRLAGLVGRAPGLPDRVQEPHRDDRKLDDRVHLSRATRASDHRSSRAQIRRRAAGPSRIGDRCHRADRSRAPVLTGRCCGARLASVSRPAHRRVAPAKVRTRCAPDGSVSSVLTVTTYRCRSCVKCSRQIEAGLVARGIDPADASDSPA
jgi:NADH:ubiquinone reductase (H+-translocating)